MEGLSLKPESVSPAERLREQKSAALERQLRDLVEQQTEIFQTIEASETSFVQQTDALYAAAARMHEEAIGAKDYFNEQASAKVEAFLNSYRDFARRYTELATSFPEHHALLDTLLPVHSASTQESKYN